jgi:hypothetical protein
MRPQDAAGHVIDEMYAAGLLDDEGAVHAAKMLRPISSR